MSRWDGIRNWDRTLPRPQRFARRAVEAAVIEEMRTLMRYAENAAPRSRAFENKRLNWNERELSRCSMVSMRRGSCCSRPSRHRDRRPHGFKEPASR